MQPEPEVVELDLRHYVRVLARRRVVVAGTALAIVALTLIQSLLQETVYMARSKVLVAVGGEQSLFDNPVPVVDPNRKVQTEVLAFDSPQVRDEVRGRIGSAPRVDAHQLEQTDVVEVVAKAPDGRRAAEVANAYAEAYVELRRRQAFENVASAAQQLQAKISELQDQIDRAGGEQQNALIDQQAIFRQKLDELQIDSAVQGGGARVISEATVPETPHSPAPLRSGIVALAFGLLLGVGVALGLEYLDDSVRTAEDLARLVPDVGVIGLIPVVPQQRASVDPFVVSLAAPGAPASEAFRTLRTSLAFLSLEHRIGVVQVTSPNPAEGKSAVVANLAVAVARAGRPVVAVDCDLRRPRLHSYFGLDGTVGLMSVLAGDVPLEEALVPVPGLDRLHILPAGPVPANPAEVLVASRTAEVFADLTSRGGVVLLDSPPVLPVTDALVISARAQGTVVVCMAGKTTRKQMRRGVELLRRVKAPIVGLILNAVDPGESYGGSYDYQERDAPSRPLRPSAPETPAAESRT